MSYTIADWLRDHAEIQLRVPDGQGGTIMRWVPADVGNLIDYDRIGVDVRTSPGNELEDFRRVLGESDG